MDVWLWEMGTQQTGAGKRALEAPLSCFRRLVSAPTGPAASTLGLKNGCF